MTSFSTEDVDIIITDPPILNLRYFDQWLQDSSLKASSLSPDESESLNWEVTWRGPKFVGQNITDAKALHSYEKANQYRLFAHLEHYFSVPYILTPHLEIWFQIPAVVQKKLIEKYYTYDDSLMREILNKKLAKSRKELDDVQEVLSSSGQSRNLLTLLKIVI